MLRVEASDLPKPRRVPRPRRLLPVSGLPARARQAVPAPQDAGQTGTVPRSSAQATASGDTWSVRLELGDDEIARLYGQGMARGAVVWKKGMVEWRPLLITPELRGLLKRTRLVPSEPPPAAATIEEPAPPRLPPPPRLPSDAPVELARSASVAPLAVDAPVRSTFRRPFELIAVACVAFGLAWFTRARFRPAPTPIASAFAAVASASSCEPAASPLSPASTSQSSIPTVSVLDLPLAGNVGTSSVGSRSASVGAAARSMSRGGPSRGDLLQALGRVAGAASGCGERPGPVRLIMSFAQSGVARSIQVTGAGLPAQTRSCIIAAASRARVPAFGGEPVTVSKTL